MNCLALVLKMHNFNRATRFSKTDLRLRSHQSGTKKSSHPQSLATIFSQLKYFPRPRWAEYILPLWREKAWWCWIQSRSWFHYVNGLGHASPIQPDYHLFSKFENQYCTVFLHYPVVQWVFVKWVKRFCSFPFVPPDLIYVAALRRLKVQVTHI